MAKALARWLALRKNGHAGFARRRAMVQTFDWLEARWESAAARRWVAAMLAAVFVLSVLAVELSRRGIVPAGVAEAVGTSHFYAVQVAFYLLLAYEVLGLVFGLARSVSNAAGKQLEIFSLILLRRSFESFGHLEEPVRWEQASGVVMQMVSDAVGALAIFVVLGFYYRLQRHRPLSADRKGRATFIAAKKAIALALLVVFVAVGGRSILFHALLGQPSRFFEQFYTLLIFADILIVLISVRYSSTYRVVFRNSGLAVATLLLRLGLSAPAFANAALGLAAALFALALTAAYNAFSLGPEEEAGAAPPQPSGD